MTRLPYVPRQRKSIGSRIAESFEAKKKRKKAVMELTVRGDEEESFVSQQADVEKVGTEQLVPEVPHWVETPEVLAVKNKIAAWLSLGYPVHLIGPTGCGKTAVALMAAKEMGRPAVWINGDASTTTTDLVGGYSQMEQETIRDKYIHNVFKDKEILRADWIDNPLTTACKQGYTFIYNEFSRALPSANNVLLSVFQEEILELPTQSGAERYVKVHPNFRAIFTSNSVEYAGIHRPQDALLDRMVGVYMDFYGPETEAAIVKSNTSLSEADAWRVVKIIRLIRSKMLDGAKPGTRAAIMVGQAYSALAKPSNKELEGICADVLSSKTKNIEDWDSRLKVVREAVKAVS